MGHHFDLTLTCLIWSLLYYTASAEIYYVTPIASSPCPEVHMGAPCFTFSQYASQTNFASNTTLVLLPGNHSLVLELAIENISLLTITAANTSLASSVTCVDFGRFQFENISQVAVNNVGFYQCVNNTVELVEQLTLQNCTFHGQDRYGTGLRMNQISNAEIIGSSFDSFIAKEGGAMIITNSNNMSILNTLFEGSEAEVSGGALHAIDTDKLNIESSFFISNTVKAGRGTGGAIYTLSSSIMVINTMFVANFVTGKLNRILFGSYAHGGAVGIVKSNATIFNSTFSGNKAGSLAFGGAIATLDHCVVNITFCKFINNTSGYHAGGAYFYKSSCHMCNNVMMNNSGAGFGGSIFVASSNLSTSGYLNISHDTTQGSAILSSNGSINCTGSVTMANNYGGLYLYSSNVIMSGTTTIMSSLVVQKIIITDKMSTSNGRAFTCYQSNITLAGTTNLVNNMGYSIGGAIFASDSILEMYGNTTIANNSVSGSGGGIYTYQSELNFRGRTIISGNNAREDGGGICIVGSSIDIYKSLNLTNNSAKRGGGIYLEQGAQLLVKKFQMEYSLPNGTSNREEWLTLDFTNNTAEYGGALYYNDTNSDACVSQSMKNEFHPSKLVTDCFFQTLAFYEPFSFLLSNNDSFSISNINVRNTYFTNNNAVVAGGTLFGGLLDRCTLNLFSEGFLTFLEILSTNHSLGFYDFFPSLDIIFPYLTNFVEQDLESSVPISSNPVRVYFCRNSSLTHVRKGQTFRIPVVAVDQTKTPVPATIVSSVKSGHLDGGQVYQTINATCSDLEYRVFSPSSSDTINLHADGPCNNIGLSGSFIEIQFEPCPIGFEDTQDGCICDSCLSSKYISDCSIDNESVLRKDNVWITVDNTSDQITFVTHPNCPFDYCRSSTEEVYVNLNIKNGSDAQCAFNRSGKLCGSCEEGLSLTFGSSNCKKCSNTGIAFLIASAFALLGILLVVLLLFLRMTVAVGTINGLIFYANIIAANRAVFLPFDSPNFSTIFIAWLNLDFGFETCFYDGLDGYAKTWLQFVFPAYVIFLVIIVIVVANKSQRCSKLISKLGEPVETLATLVLLSYTKFLRTIIAILSYAILEHHTTNSESDSKCELSRKDTVWLVDANISYFEGKHIPLFLTAILVIVACLIFTTFLLCWQWLQRCSDKRGLCWISYTRLNILMDSYLTPYSKECRFWLGILLLARVVLYIIVSLTDDTVTLLTVICLTGGLFFLKESISMKVKVYKTRLMNVLESSFILNLGLFAAATLYIRSTTGGNQIALANTSVSIAFITFVGIIVYHVKDHHLIKKLMSLCLQTDKPADQLLENIHQDEQPLECEPVLPTYSVVEGIPANPVLNNFHGNEQPLQPKPELPTCTGADRTPTEHTSTTESNTAF